ncbi:pathogenesis-related protein STH-2 [Eucalyptus grandis]|uniref:pathogenesis-related protein STH-2 n=1 Tax=Eucalyptus grandis TaxID=71139 RepID=UPI00192EFD5E|nr:pathogenesis-related protein STH-2 [Eucalyptus grandis]
MGATSFTQELICPIAPARILKALIVESNTLIPKLLPQFIKSVRSWRKATVEPVQGDSGAGSTEQNVKHQIDKLDKENFMCRNTMIEGDALGDKLQSIDYEVKFEATSDGGSVCRMASKDNSEKALQVEEEEI